MKCPYCKHNFPMTWPLYIRTPLGRHKCLSCHKKSKFGWSKRYLIYFQIPYAIVAFILTFLLLYLLSGSWVAVVLAMCVSVIFGIPIDRYVEDRLKELEPIDVLRTGKRAQERGKHVNLDKMHFWKKIVCISFSLVFSIIAGNIVFIPFIIILGASLFADIINGLIALIGIGLYIFVIVVCFRKAYRYLNKEILTEC